MASKEDGPSHVRSLQGSFDNLGLESYICRCYRGPVVRHLTHEGSFPLSPQTAFPNREVIKELSTTLRFTSSGVLPRFYQEPVIQMLFFVTALIQSLQDTER